MKARKPRRRILKPSKQATPPAEERREADASERIETHPVALLAMMGGPMTGDESDFWPAGLCPEEDAADSTESASPPQQNLTETPSEIHETTFIPAPRPEVDMWERIAQNVLKDGLARSIEEARKMVHEAL